jgi:glycosyltransferase involved in cell wall biosynthesis
VIFVWIGGSIVEDFYARQVQQYLDERPWLKEKVKILGFRKDAIELMADFDVFLLTSDSEGMPLVVLEALNQGIPIVSTDVGCVKELTDSVYSREEDLALNLSKVLNESDRKDTTSHKYKELYSRFIENYISIYGK